MRTVDKDNGERVAALSTALRRAPWIWHWFVQPAIVSFGGNREGVRKSEFSFWGLNRGERWVICPLGPYSAVWPRQLRCIGPGNRVLPGSATKLEEGWSPSSKDWQEWRPDGMLGEGYVPLTYGPSEYRGVSCVGGEGRPV